MRFKIAGVDSLLAIFSCIIAIILWLVVQSQVDPHLVREYSIPLEIRHLKDGLTVSHAPNYVTVIADGTESELDRISLDQLAAYVNLSNAKVGQKSYPIHFANYLNSNANLVLKKPEEIIVLEKLVKKEIKVSLEEQGLPSSELIYGGATVNPEVIEISGPETQVSQVKKARAILNLSGLRPGTLVPSIIELIGDKNQYVPRVFAKPPVVMINPSLAPAPASKSIIINPIWRGAVAFGYKVESYSVEPNQVRIKGKSQAVAKVQSLETEAIDLNNLNQTTTFNVKLKTPSGTEIQGPEKVKVVVTIKQIL